MSTLAAWQSFARSTNLKGWSRLKKNELVAFLLENLWQGGGRKKAARNPLNWKNKKIRVPILIPEKRNFPSRAIPRVIEENTGTVSDWANWLESVDDVNIRRRANPAVERLKKQIAKLWEQRFIVEEGKSALKNFAKQFVIQGDDSVSPQDFFQKVRWHLFQLLKENPQTKVKCVLNVEMSRTSEEEEIIDEPFFHSRQKKNLGNNMEIIDEMEREMIENLENFNRRGSNWVFERVIRLEIHFVRWNPLRGSSWIALPPALKEKKALINMKNEDNLCFKWCIARAKNPVAVHPERITPDL